MSFMKKLVGMKSVAEQGRQCHVQDNSLGLMHLRKLFAEFRHPAPKATQKDQEDKLYTMLPLFCKVRHLTFLVAGEAWPSHTVPT